MITVHGLGRCHGRAGGGAGATVAEGDEGGTAARPASPAADRRHTVPSPDRSSVAGRPRRVRTVEPDLRPVPPVAAQRHLAPDPYPSPDPGRREGRDCPGPERRLHGMPRPSARGRGPQAGRPAEGTTGRHPGEGPRAPHRTGPASRPPQPRVRADKPYASRRNRAYLCRRGIRRTIPDKADQARACPGLVRENCVIRRELPGPDTGFHSAG
jgi:hypothetical protein